MLQVANIVFCLNALLCQGCPQWSAVGGTDHHSEKIPTTTNSLKYQHKWKCLASITSWFTQQHIRMYIHSVYKESSRHYLSIEIKDHKFWKFKTHLYNHHSSKPGYVTAMHTRESCIFCVLMLPVVYPLKYLSNACLSCLDSSSCWNASYLECQNIIGVLHTSEQVS